MMPVQVALVEMVVLAVAVGLALLAWSRFERTLPRHVGPDGDAGTGAQTYPRGQVWIIYNPIKAANHPDFFDQAVTACRKHAGADPLWIATTPDDPGTGQAITARKWQPQIVIAAGGDGTVRAVAAGMAHGDVPMGIVPLGTGNLFARNLGLPLDCPAAFERALTGRIRRIDLAWLRLEDVNKSSKLPCEGQLVNQALGLGGFGLGEAGLGELDLGEVGVSRGPLPRVDEFAYLVIAGVGFDGKTMEATDPQLKKRVGWSAYVVASWQYLLNVRMQAKLSVYNPQDVSATIAGLPAKVLDNVIASQTIGARRGPVPAQSRNQHRETTSLHARTILFANCGSLPFARLAPDAAIDDGLLDVVAVDTHGGLWGWVNLAAKVLSQGLGLRAVNLRGSLSQIAFRQGTGATVELRHPETVEVDGDPIGCARVIHARVDQGALQICL